MNNRNFGKITIPLLRNILPKISKIMNNIIISIAIMIIALPSNEYNSSKSKVILKPFNSVCIMFSV